MRVHIACLAFLCTVALPASAVALVELPVEVGPPGERAGEQQLVLRPLAVTELLEHARVTLAGFPLSDGTRVDIALERLDLQQLQFGLRVDGEPAHGLLEGLDLSVWSGRVVGRERSEAALAFSQAGAQGWVQVDGVLHHLMSRGADEVWIVSEARLAELGGTRGLACASDGLPENPTEPRPAPPASGGSMPNGGASSSGRDVGTKAGSPSLYVCPIAIETDWQLNQVFGGDLQAQAAYVASLLTWTSYRYEEQIGTVLTYPYVQFYTTPNDPWHTPDVGGYLSCIDLLYEFQAAWGQTVPAGAQLCHFLSGADLGCGAAFIGGLCDATRNFGVSGNIDGQTQFPIQVSPSNLNFYLVTHELGHNFNAIHTHDYCPPLDRCVANCTGTTGCSPGTIMSYCHVCPTGFANITTYFHPQSVADMRAWVEATCLPLYAPDPVPYCVATLNSAGCAPLIGWEGHPTLSGLDDFAVTAEWVVNGKVGLLFHGSAAAVIPFQGGTLCVALPVVRTAVQTSGGTPPPGNDCSGTFRFEWSHAGLASLGAGSTVYAQYWYRDPLAPGAVGLTDALSFSVEP